MTIEHDIALGERLGRGVFSSSKAKRARRGRVLHNVFLEKAGEAEISTDRLDKAPVMEAISVAESVAVARGDSFYGWATLDAEIATQSGRKVEATPRLDNPYHADIVLPGAAIEDREVQKRHAQELADASKWLDLADAAEQTD